MKTSPYFGMLPDRGGQIISERIEGRGSLLLPDGILGQHDDASRSLGHDNHGWVRRIRTLIDSGTNERGH